MADETDEKTEGSADQKNASGHKSAALVVIVVGVLVMILAPLASWLVVKFTINPKLPAGSARETAATGPQTILNMSPILVNVAGTRGTRVLRIQSHLILSEPRLSEQLQNIMPIVTDRAISIASRRTLDQLETVDDREALKRDIGNEINAMIRDRFSGTVLEVVFSEFLVQ
jgi:flagellar basal body-associated protein FliL